MLSEKNTRQPSTKKVWFISPGQYAKDDQKTDRHAGEATATVTYKISEIADYMLNPASLEIQSKLVGCNIHHNQSHKQGANKSGAHKLGAWYRKLLNKVLPGKINPGLNTQSRLPEMVTSEMDTEPGQIKDKNLRLHIRGIYNQLKPYDPVIKALSGLDLQSVSDIEGVCRDEAGNFTNIALSGTLDEKISYIIKNLLQQVPLALKKAYMGDGLFEMSGFDFSAYKPENTYWLVKSMEKGNSQAYVLSNDQKVRYHVQNIEFVFYLQLLEQLLKVNPELMNALAMCIADKAKPSKLFFKRQLGIDYSPEQIPEIYQEVFKKYNIDVSQKKIVANALRDRQLGISFMYVPQNDSGKNCLETNLSVLHNYRALDAIRKEAPQVFSEIGNMAATTDVGKFYLLDKYNGSTQ